jgi:hypothetical protein
MAFLPHINDTWRRKADQRINFLGLFSDKHSTSKRLPAAKALMHAAELGFATGQVSRGCDLMEQALSILMQGNPTEWPVVRISILGALTKQMRTSLQTSGIVLQNGAITTQPMPWRGSANTLHRVAGTLIAAAVCCRSLDTTLALLLLPVENIPDANSRLAFLALANALEADTLPIFGFSRRDDGGLNLSSTGDELSASAISGFTALHLRYAARLRLLASDQAHWRDLRPRVPLIDWALLGLHIAAIRHHKLGSLSALSATAVGPTLNFVGSLASEIAQRY